MKKTAKQGVLILAIMAMALLLPNALPEASANPDAGCPLLSMPVEYINYTITNRNGTLWAQIDGQYPIYIENQSSCPFDGTLPMVYPMPPESTNIQVTFNGEEQTWSNYTADHPSILHRTAIGDWWMIRSLLSNVSEQFLLEIHYEHPLQRINDSYVFLYDLNIASYLSSRSPSSTAHFTLRFSSEVDPSNLQVFTAPPEASYSQWESKSYSSTSDGETELVRVTMTSHYGEPLAGDLIIVLPDAKGSDVNCLWVIPVLAVAVLVVLAVAAKRRGCL